MDQGFELLSNPGATKMIDFTAAKMITKEMLDDLRNLDMWAQRIIPVISTGTVFMLVLVELCHIVRSNSSSSGTII